MAGTSGPLARAREAVQDLDYQQLISWVSARVFCQSSRTPLRGRRTGIGKKRPVQLRNGPGQRAVTENVIVQMSLGLEQKISHAGQFPVGPSPTLPPSGEQEFGSFLDVCVIFPLGHPALGAWQVSVRMLQRVLLGSESGPLFFHHLRKTKEFFSPGCRCSDLVVEKGTFVLVRIWI